MEFTVYVEDSVFVTDKRYFPLYKDELISVSPLLKVLIKIAEVLRQRCLKTAFGWLASLA